MNGLLNWLSPDQRILFTALIVWHLFFPESHNQGAGGVNGAYGGGEDYVTPNKLVEAVQATYDYEAIRDDELTFKKGDFITNVKTMQGKPEASRCSKIFSIKFALTGFIMIFVRDFINSHGL